MTKMGGWVLLVLLGLFQDSAASTREDKRPNIVFILTDDQDVEIGGMVKRDFDLSLACECGRAIIGDMFIHLG